MPSDSVINAIYIFKIILLFYVGKRRYRLQKPLPVQRYTKILIYANLLM